MWAHGGPRVVGWYIDCSILCIDCMTQSYGEKAARKGIEQDDYVDVCQPIWEDDVEEEDPMYCDGCGKLIGVED